MQKQSPNWFDRKEELEAAGLYSEDLRWSCPCCQYPTLPTLFHEICGICFWQVDGLEFNYPINCVIGGPNSDYSLAEARDNFSKFACFYRPADENFANAEKNKVQRLELAKKLSAFRGIEYVNLPDELREGVDTINIGEVFLLR